MKPKFFIRLIIVKIFKIIIIGYLMISSIVLAQDFTVPDNFANRQEVKEFMQYMHTKYNFNLQQLENLFKNYASNKYVLDKIANPSEKLSWEQYKKLLITHDRIIKGKQFLSKYHNILLKAEKQFMVPKEIIVAILGIESFYGERSGSIPVIESLATLSFDYPPRKAFFKKELEQFLLLIKEENLDPNQIKGSYAGAMSPAQFISTSYRNYAVDFANIGRKDLNNMSNAIGSIGNYLHKHGWSKSQPIAMIANMPIKHKNNTHQDYLNYINQDLGSPKPKHLLKKLNNLGIAPKDFKFGGTYKASYDPKSSKNAKIFNNYNSSNKIPNHLLNQEVALMEFESEGQSREYWLGFNNFYVITRYNHSTNYAMAVYQLAVNLGLKV